LQQNAAQALWPDRDAGKRRNEDEMVEIIPAVPARLRQQGMKKGMSRQALWKKSLHCRGA
jgi:hypothetical protein